MLNHRFLVLLIASFLFVLPPTAVKAKVIPVSCSTDSLIAAINHANSIGGANTLDLAARCVYTIIDTVNEGDRGNNGLPQITSDITVIGNNAVILRGDTTVEVRFFQVNTGAALKLEQVTLYKGGVDSLTSDGGAVNILEGGQLTLEHCTLIRNYAGCGGAINSAKGTIVNITDSFFTENSADG